MNSVIYILQSKIEREKGGGVCVAAILMGFKEKKIFWDLKMCILYDVSIFGI
jgi:hypothetical protein